MSNQIQLREHASYSYCAHSWRQQTNPLRKKISIRLKMLSNNWFIRQLCVHQDMKHLRSLESTQEVRAALSYASSNSYTSFVLSKPPACFISHWTHAGCYDPDRWWEWRKNIIVGMLTYETIISWNQIGRNVWYAIKRITINILGVKGKDYPHPDSRTIQSSVHNFIMCKTIH